jgi:hypothetical protein
MDTIAPFRITVCGIEELTDHRETGASHVLSILDPDRPVAEAFGSFGEHKKLELRFHDVIEEEAGRAPSAEGGRGPSAGIWPRPDGRAARGCASSGALPCRHFAVHGVNGAHSCTGAT